MKETIIIKINKNRNDNNYYNNNTSVNEETKTSGVKNNNIQKK